MTSVAYYSTLYRMNLPILGIAMRDPAGRVWFIDDATGRWQELTDADAPHLMLHGRVDIAQAQARADGDLVTKASRTLQAA
jgi:hypothetical protein